MKKKVLSLALTLAMCLGLTVPAFAADAKAGDTSITDSNGVTYQFSNPLIAIETNKTVTYIGFEGEKESEVLEKAYILPKGTIITIIAPNGYQQSEFLLDGVMFENANDPSDTISIISGTWAGMGGVPKEGLELYHPYVTVASMHGSQHSGAYYFVEADAETPVNPKPTVPASGTAYASTQSVTVDGQKVEFQMYALKDANGNDTNYIKLRDLAQILNGTAAQFEVGWNGAVNIETGKAYTSNGSEMSTPFSGDRAYETATAVTNINGSAANLSAFILKDDNGGAYTYYQLRDLGKALGFNVDWSADKGIFVETDKPYSE